MGISNESEEEAVLDKENFFVISVSGYQDTQYGDLDYPDMWCVSSKKYCRSSNIDKVRKFETFREAENYINSIKPRYKQGRKFDIMYACVTFRGISYHPISSAEELD